MAKKTCSHKNVDIWEDEESLHAVCASCGDELPTIPGMSIPGAPKKYA